MNGIVPRTCTELPPRDSDQNRGQEPRTLEEFRPVLAYVLLGDPGAGKTTAFETEHEALEENARLITARDFLALDMNSHPAWYDKTLFIDGLDEVRVGSTDVRTPFDAIRGRLDALGRPPFRLSCREADWLGTNDLTNLATVSKDSSVTVLRLNPLTYPDIIQILNGHPDIGDAQAFIAEARERGVDGLLVNPQSLTMLADVVARGGGWPESRLETFEKACSQIVREHNEEHTFGGQSPTSNQILNAAGRLCAVQLLSGTAGYSLRHNEADDDYPALDRCDYDSCAVLKSALATKLFKSKANGRFTPVHRHIAEFLGARHLAQLINDGLPARRILALMTAEDGTVVTEMRGLSAWLSAHCKGARADLIKRDPIGVGLYGDIGGFSPDEKHALLIELNREAFRLGSVHRTAVAFGALATPDMEPLLRDILNDSSRNRDQQIFTGFILCVLNQGTSLPTLSRLLLDIVRDSTRRPDINQLALDAFIHNCQGSQNRTRQLKTLLVDIHTGSSSDPDNELLGTLLAQLYPRELPPSEVWSYLSETGNPELIGRHCRFWDTGLIEKSSDKQVAELLDNLAQRLPGLRPALDVRHLNGLPPKLLARGLEAHGDQIASGRLYDWLNLGLPSNAQDHWCGAESVRQIRAWLSQRPELQKTVMKEGLSRYSESSEFRVHAFNVQKHLYGARLPSDFGYWCLEHAIAMAETKPHVAEHLLELAVLAEKSQSGNEGLSAELLRERAETNEILKTSLARLLSPRSIPPEYLEEDRKYIDKRDQQEEQWLNYVRSNETALRENRATPVLLHQMAEIYFARFYGLSGADDGPNAIEKRLRGDRSLTDAALQGLRGTVSRGDVPDFDAIIDLREKGQRHYLSGPFLAGLAEVERTAPEDPSLWDDRRIRKAIAFYYCTPHGGYRPKWYRRLLKVCPEIVADVQVQFAVSELRSDREWIYKLWELAHDKDHAEVARHASLPLLRAFPTRCKQIRTLDHLLWAAIQYADRSSLQELIGRKLSRTSLTVAQRVHWLVAGVSVSPETYMDPLEDFVRDREHRIQHLPAFFCPEDSVRFSFDALGISGLKRLIRLVGSYVGPRQDWDQSLVTPSMSASSLVHKLIQHLAKFPAGDARDALASLCSDTTLARWHNLLSEAQENQRVIWRDAGYSHPNIEQVCKTLSNDDPANAADLAALVVDRIHEIAEEIQTGNTDDWRPYWNEDSYGRPCSPKPENSCRDALLSKLKERLPHGVAAQPEGPYANDARADIRISRCNFNVPVEIKKSCHRDLWSAIKTQLIAQYTRDPDADGYGIYLVLWFGYTEDCRPAMGSGPQLKSASELENRLSSTLSAAENLKISICVIDVAKPSRLPQKRTRTSNSISTNG